MLVFRGVHETSCIIEEWLSLTLGSIGPRTRARFGERWRVFEKELNSKPFNASKNIFDKGDFSEHFRTSEQQDFIYLFIYLFVYRYIHSLRILTPPMETPDPPSDTPGASIKVFLTPLDIPRILRVHYLFRFFFFRGRGVSGLSFNLWSRKLCFLVSFAVGLPLLALSRG